MYCPFNVTTLSYIRVNTRVLCRDREIKKPDFGCFDWESGGEVENKDEFLISMPSLKYVE